MHGRSALKRSVIIFIGIALFSSMIYLGTAGPYSYLDYFVPLANAFLHGRLNILDPPSWLSELVNFHGYYYVVYPPMPAVLLLPFVALFGPSFDQGILSVILGGLGVSATWFMLKRIGANDRKAIWLAILFGFGTVFWYAAANGSAWFIAHVSAVLFLTLAIIEKLRQGRSFITGFLLGCAYLSRLPVILSLPFFLLLDFHLSEWRRAVRKFTLLLLGLAIPVGLNVLYNYFRYGTIFDIGYFLIPGVLDEPWYQQGIFSIQYIPRHVIAIFFQGPILLNAFPYFKPSWAGLGLFFTTPAFLYIFGASWDRVTKTSVLAIFSTLPLLITHGNVGWAQFGYRFSLDFTPFLMILTAKGMSENLTLMEKSLIVLSLLVNLWGVVSILKLDFVGW